MARGLAKKKSSERTKIQMNFQNVKNYLDLALASNEENLEIVNTELQRLNSDLAQRFDVAP